MIIAIVAIVVLLVAAGLFMALDQPDETPSTSGVRSAPRTTTVKPLASLAGSGFVAEKAVAALARAWSPKIRPAGDLVDARPVSIAEGLMALLHNETDFWMTSRPAEEADLEAARQAGSRNVPPLAKFRRAGNEFQIGTAAVVVIANFDNPVHALTPMQTLKIYKGETTAWAQIGGRSNLPIARDVLTAGREETGWFCATFMGNPDVAKCLRSFGLLFKPLMDDPARLADDVASSPGGIGFVEFGNRGRARPLAFGNACGAAIEPTPFRIKAGDYPAVHPLFLYTMPDRPLSRAAKEFLSFVLSPAGGAAIEASGVTGMTPVTAEPADREQILSSIGDTAVAHAFDSATAGYVRASISFHFQVDAKTPDGAVDADIARLVAWARQPMFAKAQWSLIGHSGGGDRTDNGELAKERAQGLRLQIQAAGLRGVAAEGFGATVAATCDSDPVTAHLNRRVEVWVRTQR
jgi:ABC-type phosphate transport system substrate-binding protein